MAFHSSVHTDLLVAGGLRNMAYTTCKWGYDQSLPFLLTTSQLCHFSIFNLTPLLICRSRIHIVMSKLRKDTSKHVKPIINRASLFP